MTDIDAWIDPRPKYPDSGAVVVVKRENGIEEKMTCENTWDGRRWKSHPGGWFDSIVASPIVGWKYTT